MLVLGTSMMSMAKPYNLTISTMTCYVSCLDNSKRHFVVVSQWVQDEQKKFNDAN